MQKSESYIEWKCPFFFPLILDQHGKWGVYVLKGSFFVFVNGLLMGWRFSRMDGWTSNGVWCLLIRGLEVGMKL